MTNYDEEAFVREMQHKEMMRKQRRDSLIMDRFYQSRLKKSAIQNIKNKESKDESINR